MKRRSRLGVIADEVEIVGMGLGLVGVAGLAVISLTASVAMATQEIKVETDSEGKTISVRPTLYNGEITVRRTIMNPADSSEMAVFTITAPEEHLLRIRALNPEYRRRALGLVSDLGCEPGILEGDRLEIRQNRTCLVERER